MPKKRLWKPLEEVPPRTRQGSSRVHELVEDFLSSGAKVGEVEKWAKPASVTLSVRAYVKKTNAALSVRTVGDRVILIRGRNK